MRSVLPVVLGLVLVPAALGGAVRSVVAPATVTALAFDGPRAAYATGRSPTDCNRVFLWNTATRAVVRFGRRTHCEETSTGNAIAAVSVAGERVLWLHYVGGNTREWTLWTATVERRTPLRIHRVTTDAEARTPIVVGNGDASRVGALLPYAVGRVVFALRPDGSRRFAWTAPAEVTALSADDGELAVATEGGLVTILDANGDVLRTETFARTLDLVRLTGDGLVAQRGRSLEIRRGSSVQLLSLVAGVTVADAQGARAVLVGGGRVTVLDLGPGRARLVVPGAAAQLENGRLLTSAGRRLALRRLG